MTMFSARFEAVTASPVVMVADISVINLLPLIWKVSIALRTRRWLCGILFLPQCRVLVLVIAHVLVELGLVGRSFQIC